MYFLYSLGGVTFNKCWITLSIFNCYSPNCQGFILMKNALNNQVGMLGDMFLWLVANLKQGVIYFIKQTLSPNKSAGSVPIWNFMKRLRAVDRNFALYVMCKTSQLISKTLWPSLCRKTPCPYSICIKSLFFTSITTAYISTTMENFLKNLIKLQTKETLCSRRY